MFHKPSLSYRIFSGFNYTLLVALSFLCVLPIIHVLAVSLSSAPAVASGKVLFWPVEFTWKNYEIILAKKEFIRSFGVTFKRLILGVPLGMLMSFLVAYPLAKETKSFRFRTFYVWFFVVTMLFGGGLIPTYMVVKSVGLIDTIWALVLPGAVSVYNCILLLNFFRALPKELEESAFMDGAGHWKTLWHIYLPLSLPALATLTLFTTVGTWNEWFHGLIYMNQPENYPVSSYLQTMIINPTSLIASESSQDVELLKEISNKTAKSARFFLGLFPF